MTIQTEVLIVGDGQAATPLATALAKAGRSVAVAERRQLGGSCVNFGCTPTKAAIASARIAHQARRASEYGISIEQVDVDFGAVIGRAQRIRDRMRASLADTLGPPDNPRLIHGHARFIGRDDRGFRMLVAEDEVSCSSVILDTGTRSALPPIDGLSDISFLDASNWLEHQDRPSHVAILGAGYIGMEMAQFYRRMGCRVTVFDTGDQILHNEDEDVSTALFKTLEAEGVAFSLATTVTRVQNHNGGVRLSFDRNDPALLPGTLDASHVFIATGRQPNTDDLGLDTIGVQTDDHGFVVVDEKLRTSVDGVWAAGDIRGGPMFTHTAWDDGRILQAQLLDDGSDTTLRTVPYAVFTDPQLGRVGLTEREARAAGKSFKVGRFDMASNGKAQETGEESGLIKVLVDERSNTLLGAAVLSADAAELVHGYVNVMNAGAPIDVIRDAVFIHPTLTEATQSVLSTLTR
ncbi:FAD-dependent oxidoreductase [Thalassobaculum sp.]|uniref:FAD-dependent oxidoreductase n=1 Tax=Thalassobaculum sp. TaxID=2022740 RepID=UPI0032EAAAD7